MTFDTKFIPWENARREKYKYDIVKRKIEINDEY